jgi:uncharacterized protein with ParB-like and HNH nuclease domain
MQASQTIFQLILEGTKQYVVPLFQRAYSWDKIHWDKLWTDLIELYDSEAETRRTHFIGSLVTMQVVAVPQGVPKFLLIDGQQRYTTLSILLIAMRDLAIKQGDNNLAEDITELYFSLIQGERTEENNRINKAYDFFIKKLGLYWKYTVV